MKILCQRYIDFYKPGDEIPADRYEKEQIEKWRAMGKVLVFDPPQPAAKKAPAKKPTAKKK